MAHRKILVIDSDRESVGPLTVQLEQAGYQVEVATDGRAGLQAFADLKPDLVVLEAMLPKLHGLKVCEEIKKNPDGLSTPILMTTTGGRDREFMSEAGTIYGYQEYLEKPLSPERLVAACNRIIGASDAVAVETALPGLPALPALTTDDVMARLDAEVSKAQPGAEPAGRSRKGRWVAVALLFVAGAVGGFFALRPTIEPSAPKVHPSPPARADRAPRVTSPAPIGLPASASTGSRMVIPGSAKQQPPVETAPPPRPAPQKPRIQRKIFPRKPAIPVDLEFAGIGLDPLQETVESAGDSSIQLPSLVESLGNSLEIAPPKPKLGTLFELAEVDVAPGLVERHEPAYPALANRLGQQGDVTLNVLVDHHGTVAEVKLLRGIDRSKLNDAAIEAVRSWRYTPARKEGVAVRVWLPVKFEFRLSR